MNHRYGRAAAVVALALAATAPVAPAQSDAPRGWEISGIPALNYSPDDKFGYGLILQLFNYGSSGKLPYVVTLQPTVFLTTGGRRDFTLFADAPDVGGTGWRVDGYAGLETQDRASYYGIGNATVRNRTLEEPPNELYYRFGRDRVQITTNAQRRVGESAFRVLVGAGASRMRVREVPEGTSTTLLSEERAGEEAPDGWSNYVRAGLVWDTRDRETHTSRGTWADLLVQRVDNAFGSDWSYTRVTATLRQYVPLSHAVTFAGRVILQNVTGDAPFHDLGTVQTSFKPQDGLGGSHSLRGFARSRFLGNGLAVLNSELRWRAAEFDLLGAPSSVTMSGFVDAGRVWEGELALADLGSDLHVGYGGGIRLGRGPNFVVALDVGHSKESAAPLYIGMGFVF